MQSLNSGLRNCRQGNLLKSFHTTQLALRSITSTTRRHAELESQPSGPTQADLPPPSAASSVGPQASSSDSKRNKPLLPENVTNARLERKLWREQRKFPIGSRRRRVASQSTSTIPFEHLPYQCFQDARQVLIEDRKEKIQQIETQRARINALRDKSAAEVKGGQSMKDRKIKSMEEYLEELKILADVNDPLVKKRFEDGKGDMNKPIYRYFARKEWHAYKRKILMQRITQMSVVPDLLPAINPAIEVDLAFGKKKIHPGDMVGSALSAQAPRLRAQSFEKGEKLYTVFVVDSDVPELQKNSFGYRCHGIYTNIVLSPTLTVLDLGNQPAERTALSWLPPHAQKGSPYHRLTIFLLQHPTNIDGTPIKIDATTVAKMFERRDGVSLRSFGQKMRLAFGNNTHNFEPVGVTMFRTTWDEDTEEVMKSAGLEGWDVELKREKPLKLPYKKKDGKRYR